MVEITFNGSRYDLPEFPDELTPKQYEAVMRLAIEVQCSPVPMTGLEVRRELFAILTGGIRPARLLRADVLAEVDRHLGLLNGYFSPAEGGGEHLVWASARNLLPTYRGYKGPGDLLEGMTFGEFVECLTLLEDINADDINATFRIYERVTRVIYHIPEGEKVPELLLIHAPAMFRAVWSAIMTAPLEFNGRKIDFRIIFKGSGSGKADDKTGWSGVTFEVAAAGLFGRVSEVEKTPLWEVLLYLYKCKFEYLQEMKKTKK